MIRRLPKMPLENQTENTGELPEQSHRWLAVLTPGADLVFEVHDHLVCLALAVVYWTKMTNSDAGLNFP